MKDKRAFVILIGDGMADYPLEELGGKTPLEAARTPAMDRIASEGILGLARTVPEGIAPGSDTANLSIFGYNPRLYYTGRAPLEALNMGIDLGVNDAAFRCNFVTLESGKMKDFSAHHIESEFSRVIIEELTSEIKEPGIEFYPGVSYRNILVWRDFPYSEIPLTTPPHDITGQDYEPYLPSGEGADILRKIMNASADIICRSSAIAEAGKKYSGKPVSAWLWGGGRKPAVKPITERFGLRGSTISAVDLIHGIGRVAGLVPCRVEGATGYLDTNYEGKAKAALDCLEKGDTIVVVHVESPDESGHEGNIEHKLRAIEDFDSRVVAPIMAGIAEYDDITVLCMPDHPTPIATKTHSSDPVPFAVYRKKGFETSMDVLKAAAFTEKSAALTGLFVDDASLLLPALIEGKI